MESPPEKHITGEHLIQASDALDIEMANNEDFLGLVNLYIRMRSGIRLLRYLLVAAIVLASVGIYQWRQVNNTVTELRDQKEFAIADAANLRILCEKQNVKDAKQKAIWTEVFTKFGNMPTLFDTIKPKVEEAYIPEDCNPTDITIP